MIHRSLRSPITDDRRRGSAATPPQHHNTAAVAKQSSNTAVQQHSCSTAQHGSTADNCCRHCCSRLYLVPVAYGFSQFIHSFYIFLAEAWSASATYDNLRLSCTTFGFDSVFFPGAMPRVIPHSRMAGACPVTTDLIMRMWEQQQQHGFYDHKKFLLPPSIMPADGDGTLLSRVTDICHIRQGYTSIRTIVLQKVWKGLNGSRPSGICWLLL